MQSGGFMNDASDIIKVINLLNKVPKIMPKIINKPEDLTKKVSLNDMIKTVDTSKIFIKNSRNRNNSNKQGKKRYYESNYVFRKWRNFIKWN